MLESDEAARRLGIKVASLYAYVSRGLLVSHPAPEGRKRLFALDDVEALARRSRQGKSVETRMVTITTAVTQLTDDGPLYRGARATDLATTASFEEVADRLWGDHRSGRAVRGHGTPDVRPVAAGGPRPTPGPGTVGPVALGGGHGRRPRPTAVRPPSCGGHPYRRPDRRVDGRRPALARAHAAAARTEVPLVLPDGRDRPHAMAARLAARLSRRPDPALVRAVNAALVLLADHELATSTMAVRVAASTRADPYDAVLAGLGTLAGPLHGGASQQAYSLLVEASRHGAEAALNDTLRWQGVLPGFGHTVYKRGDARCTVLLGLFEELAPPEAVATVGALVTLAAEHELPAPNVDLGLAAVAWAAGMPPDAGRTLFAVARVAGWAAHYLEELDERPLRYRARAVYATPG